MRDVEKAAGFLNLFADNVSAGNGCGADRMDT